MKKGNIFIAIQESMKILSDTRINFENQDKYMKYLENSTSEEHWTHNFRALRDLLVYMNYLTNNE